MHLAASNIRRRLILLDREVLAERGDFERILIHEIFHFTWVRLPNSKRRSWEKLIESEIARGTAGELGWSAESRKEKLRAAAIARRSPAWRRYACESFCDSAAWLYAGLRRHEEFTLPARFRRARAQWLRQNLDSPLPV